MRRVFLITAVGASLLALGAAVAVAAALDGTTGPDKINGTGAADKIRGFAGNDDLSGRGGDDVLRGGGGKDEISGGAGSDRVYGGKGDDFIDTRDDRSKDYVACGPGFDVYNAEPQPGTPRDVFADDCEQGAL